MIMLDDKINVLTLLNRFEWRLAEEEELDEYNLEVKICSPKVILLIL